MNGPPVVSAARTAALVGAFDRGPAYVGLADALVLLVGDGRIPPGTRLPSERELTTVLAVSRTTVTRAYALLREAGYAEARPGSGTFSQLPGGRSRARDRALLPRPGDDEAIDLSCAAPTAPPQIATAYAEAAADLPAYLGGHGYFPQGLPELQAAIARTYEERGLPTQPEQVMVTPGALSATAIVARAFGASGERALVETPVYPNATESMRAGGSRLVVAPVDPDGWDLEATAAVLRRASPRLAYLIPDFQNPTGLLMSDHERETYAAHLRRSGTVAVVDEAHQALGLDPGVAEAMPGPFAAHAPSTITVGSASKSFWGGLRLGWVRMPAGDVAGMRRLVRARIHLDLGAPVMEQLVLTRLLADPAAVLTGHRQRLRQQRDALVTALARALPEWGFRVPAGGLALWCELPAARASALATAAQRHGVLVSPGPVFAVEGGLDRYVRLPWTRPAGELEEAVRRLALAWAAVRDAGPARRTTTGRVMVA